MAVKFKYVVYQLKEKEIYNYCCIAVRIFDLGQNMAGLCRLKFQGRSGYGTTMRHGEILAPPTIPN